MKKWESLVDILDYAIAREVDAQDFYSRLAGQAGSEAMADVFRGFELEERAHQERLEGFKRDGKITVHVEDIQNMKMAEYMVDVQETPELTYQQALVIAMKQEMAAFKLYSDLADLCDDNAGKTLLQTLAQEEAKHKLRFEREYDEVVLIEN